MRNFVNIFSNYLSFHILPIIHRICGQLTTILATLYQTCYQPGVMIRKMHYNSCVSFI